MIDCGSLGDCIRAGEHPAEKDTNPKDALGAKKVPMHCVSAAVLMELGLAMMEGGRKYGTHNYRSMGVRASVYYDATQRHMMAFWEGQDIDPDSGVSHIVKAIAGLVVLRDSMIMKNWEDDRPIRLPKGLDVANLNEQAAKIIEKYPECKRPFTHARKLAEEVEEKLSEHFGPKKPKHCQHTYKTIDVCNCTSCKGIRRIEKKTNLGRVGEPWDSFEETYLRYMVGNNRPVAEIAKMHKRTNGAIRSRMEHMGLEFKAEVKHEEGKITYDNAVGPRFYFHRRLCWCKACQSRWELH